MINPNNLSKKERYKLRIKDMWFNYWYEWQSIKNPKFGNKRPQGWKTFRKQRLFNIIILFLIMILLYITIKINIL